MQLNTGAKVWLWFALIVNVLTFIISIPVTLMLGGIYYISLICSIGMIVGIAIILFKKKKIGYFACCGCAVVSFILNLVLHTNIIFAVIGAVGFPLITYLVLRSQWNELG